MGYVHVRVVFSTYILRGKPVLLAAIQVLINTCTCMLIMIEHIAQWSNKRHHISLNLV